MRITFEGVGYSYTTPAASKKQTKGQNRRNNTSQSSLALTTHGEPKWGYNAQNLWALQDINFTLNEGEFLGIAGHTGSGKSTLIQHLNGLIHPTVGRVLIDGENLTKSSVARACRGRVGLVFQYPEHQLFAATVYEDVAFGPRNLGLEEAEVERRVIDALKNVQLPFDEVHDKSPFALSGGQQRRVAFAGVLAMKPEVLVLDEPVAGLDPVAREEFLRLIGELHHTGLAIVMVSHSMEDLARFSDRILVLNAGRQHALGTPADIFANAQDLRAIGLDVPRAQRLADELREAGINLPAKLYDVQSLADALSNAALRMNS